MAVQEANHLVNVFINKKPTSWLSGISWSLLVSVYVHVSEHDEMHGLCSPKGNLLLPFVFLQVAIPEHELNGELEGEVEDEDEITQFDLDIVILLSFITSCYFPCGLMWLWNLL